MTVIAEDEAGRGFQSRIIASVSTPAVVAQVLDLEVAPDRELVLCERTSTIALQRQIRQNFAAGRFECESGSRSYDDIGRLIFVPAMTPLRIKYEGKSISIVRCMFPQATFDATFAAQGAATARKLRNCLNVKSPTIRELMIKVAREVEGGAQFAHDLVQCYGQVLVIELKRYFEQCAADGGLSRGGMSNGALRKVIERIEAEDLPPSLDELASISGLSKRHLCRSFKQSTGQTVLEKINESRFNRAAAILSQGQISIHDVAVKSGFKSTSSFSNAYRDWFGTSPTKDMKSRETDL